MPDPIAAAFTGRWRLTATPVEDGGTPVIVGVMVCQEAWRRLTPVSRKALLAVEAEPGRALHWRTREALRGHGLIDDTNQLTEAGSTVVRHRPVKTSTPDWIGGRPVINVHLPALTEVTT